MRIALLAALLGLSLVGCAGQIGDAGGGGDDVAPSPDCGNGAIDTGETCDDGATTSGDGCSATCQTEATPRLDISVDKPTISTELMSTNMVTVTLTGSDGFTGAVNLAATLVNATDTPITAWTVALDTSTVTVPIDGTATAVATLTIPSDSKVLTGSLKIAATSSAGVGTFTSTSAVTATNQVTINMKLDANGQCIYPAAGTTNLVVGSNVRWLNTEAADSGNRITIHINNGDQYGVPHQSDPGSDPGTAYERTLTGTPAGTFSWYCHAPGPDVGNTLRLQPVQ